MTCKSCPTRIRCFLGIRNCQPTPVVGGIVSGNSSSIGDGRLDVGRVADENLPWWRRLLKRLSW